LQRDGARDGSDNLQGQRPDVPLRRLGPLETTATVLVAGADRNYFLFCFSGADRRSRPAGRIIGALSVETAERYLNNRESTANHREGFRPAEQ